MGSELGGTPALEAVAAGLRRDSSDLALYGGFLLNTVTEALPPEMVQVERRRSAGDRLHGRPGELTAVQVDLGDHRFRLQRTAVGVRPPATVAHASAPRSFPGRASSHWPESHSRPSPHPKLGSSGPTTLIRLMRPPGGAGWRCRLRACAHRR